MTDPAAIAARLTEAQKRALEAFGRYGDEFLPPAPRAVRADVAYRLANASLLEVGRYCTYRITPLGRAVLAEIEKGHTE